MAGAITVAVAGVLVAWWEWLRRQETNVHKPRKIDVRLVIDLEPFYRALTRTARLLNAYMLELKAGLEHDYPELFEAPRVNDEDRRQA